jgi:uncharacterized membrane protein YfcA
MNPHASSVLLVLIGMIAGTVSGFFGIGGGIIIVPALIYLAGFSQLGATGTSLAILLPPVGLAAVLEYHRHGNVNLRAALIVAASMFVTAWIASRLAHRVSPAHLRFAFGIFIVFMGFYIVWTSFRMR